MGQLYITPRSNNLLTPVDQCLKCKQSKSLKENNSIFGHVGHPDPPQVILHLESFGDAGQFLREVGRAGANAGRAVDTEVKPIAGVPLHDILQSSLVSCTIPSCCIHQDQESVACSMKEFDDLKNTRWKMIYPPNKHGCEPPFVECFSKVQAIHFHDCWRESTSKEDTHGMKSNSVLSCWDFERHRAKRIRPRELENQNTQIEKHCTVGI